MTDLRTPDEWLATDEFAGWVVLDPDGWDRLNFEKSWAERIDHATFTARLVRSTCKIPVSAFTPKEPE